jgi:hypothetical protein
VGTSRDGCLHPPRTPRSTQPPLAMSSRHRTKTTTSKGDDNSPGPQLVLLHIAKDVSGQKQGGSKQPPVQTHSLLTRLRLQHINSAILRTSPGSPYVRPTHRTTTTTTTRKGAILDPERNVPIPSRLLGPFSSFVARRKKCLESETGNCFGAHTENIHPRLRSRSPLDPEHGEERTTTEDSLV